MRVFTSSSSDAWSPIESHSEASIVGYAGASAWCTSAGKRVFDLVCASLLLIVAIPLMLFVSLAVATSPGPLIFAHDRLGQGGKRIRVFKFRTMTHRKAAGLALTRKGDDRVTNAGRFLRAWKLDELPQLINVLRGEMSMVGPRPDSAEFLEALPSDLGHVLVLKPGITSKASLQFRNEEEILGRVPVTELTRYYETVLLPHKIQIDLEYAQNASMLTDLKLLMKTISAILL